MFQKVYDEIKYLCKVATAGSKEARQLEKVKKIFAEVYRTTEAKTNTAQDGGVKYSLGDVNYQRRFIDYNDINERRSTEDETVSALMKQGKVTTIAKENIPAELSDINWENRGEARSAIEGILKEFLGKDVVFTLGEGSAIAYLTSKGIDHTLAGDNTKSKATALSQFYNLISNAEYSYSTPKDSHSKTAGREDWDYFVSVAEIEGGDIIPLVFAVRSIDQDVRSQIYSIATKKNSTIPRGDGTQGNPANAHPSYGDSSSSDSTVTQDTPGVKGQLSLSGQNDIAPPRGNFHITGKDISLEGVPIRSDIAPVKPNPALEGVPIRKDLASQARAEGKMPHISLEEYANSESPVWRNVAYNDDATKAKIMQQTHDAMVAEGAVVKVADDVTNDVDQAFPDLRSMKKTERNPILKTAMKKLKADLRNFLNGFKDQSFEFEVNGKVLDATLYNTGINEVLEKVTKEKANMLYSTEGIFKNARYLYSTPDYDGDPNVYRWNYFYTPVQIGNETVGVRIAVRDVATPRGSQIYNWGIKKTHPWAVWDAA